MLASVRPATGVSALIVVRPALKEQGYSVFATPRVGALDPAAMFSLLDGVADGEPADLPRGT